MTDPDAPIPFHRPNIGDGERRAVLDVLDSGWLTTGARTAEFEAAFGAFVGATEVVAVNSATAALHLAFDALGVAAGDEVIVPTYTFAASAETILYQGARPVLVDVDPSTANVDPRAIAAAVGPSTRAIEVVHVGGLPADMIAILAAAGSLPVVEDTAHAFPSPIPALGGRMAGTIGRVGAFSFYATKTITTGEGGMLVTDDHAIAERARSMRLHGIGRDAWKRYSASGTWYYEIEASGFKVNMTDIAAAIGLAQLGRADELRAMRAAIARRYTAGLADAERAGQIELPRPGQGDEHAWHLYVIRLPRDSGAGGSVDEDSPVSSDCHPSFGPWLRAVPARSTGSDNAASGPASTSSRSICTRCTGGWVTGRASSLHRSRPTRGRSACPSGRGCPKTRSTGSSMLSPRSSTDPDRRRGPAQSPSPPPSGGSGKPISSMS